MKMLLNKHRLITERQQRAWSQSQLAEVSAVSLRTIQRIEKNGKSSLETAKAIAAVFGLKITDLYIPDSSSEDLSVPTQSMAESFCFLSSMAKTITMTIFLLSTLVLLFMSWTGIPKLIWINEFRDAVFSQHLSTSALRTISTSLIMISTLVVATIIGLLFDALRNQGFYLYLISYVQSDEFSFNRFYKKSRQVATNLGKFSLKVVIISCTIILISAGLIYLDMEEYQKHNMTRFLQKHF